MTDSEQLREAKERLSEAAMRCLTGDPQAAADADAAMAEIKQLLAEQAAAPIEPSETVA